MTDRKNRSKLIITLSVVLIVAVGVAVSIILINNNSEKLMKISMRPGDASECNLTEERAIELADDYLDVLF